jgi:hypothetical protein
MHRVIVKTTTEITANLEANKIEDCGELIKIYNDNELVGVFDVGIIQFLYKTKSSGKG